MRKLTAYLLISLDGVCESPDTFAPSNVIPDIFPLIAETISEQDAVLLGRRTYDDWSGYWPTSDVEPFASFINRVPKFVLSTTMTSTDWSNASVLSGDFSDRVFDLKASSGNAIGVHGSISVVQWLLSAKLLDELQLVILPSIVGKGRRLFNGEYGPLHFELVEERSTPLGLIFARYRRLI